MVILKTLALEPMHGYGIPVRIEQMSKGVFRPNVGSPFLAIQRLQRDGLIDGEWRPTVDGWLCALFYEIMGNVLVDEVCWTCILSGGFSKIVFFKQVTSCTKIQVRSWFHLSPSVFDSNFQAFLLRQYPFCCVFLARSIAQEGGSENKGNLSSRVFRPPTLLNCEPQVSPVLIEKLACISKFLFREFQQFSSEEFKWPFEFLRPSAPYLR